jgi:hypothetical protein
MVKGATYTLLAPTTSFRSEAAELEAAFRVFVLTVDTADFFVASDTMRALS